MSKLNLKTSPTVLFSQVEAVTNMSTLIGRMNGRNSIDRCDALCALNKINGGVLVQTTCTPRESSCYECLLVWHATSSLVIVLFVFSLCGILCTTNAPGMPPGHYTLHGSVPSWPCMELGEWVRPVWESEQSVQSVHSGISFFPVFSSKAESLTCVESSASRMFSGMQWRRQSCCQLHSFCLSGHHFHDVMIILQTW